MFAANGSMTSLKDMPAEIIDMICHGVTLEDIANLQESNPELDRAIDFVFFPRFTKMRIMMDANGSTLTVSPRSAHSLLGKSSFSIPFDSPKSQQIIRACTAVDSITISVSDHAHHFRILEAINRSGIAVTKLVVNFYTPKDCAECKVITTRDKGCRGLMNRAHRKITTFVREQSKTLTKLKVSTSEEDSISVELRPADGASTSSESRVIYSHAADSALNQSLINPIFTAFNLGKASGPGSVHLTVDWRSRLDLALQGAFMVALPIGHRGGVNKMRIGFSSKVSSLSHDEIHSCLEAFSDQLSETRRLKELICDFKSSQIDPHLLDKTVSVLSKQLVFAGTESHRIRMLFDAPIIEEPNRIKQEWAALPKVY
ncbi:hypothetical protein PRIPAC_86063 [Pristionchus pacificus]|uniref:Uncharacterized protein n=1 Tax=Pristionchus pacificus TaxID=54126 RepID=A0A2A6BP80_PRIPA|nr:hypothetical protein PRIPAC_86063 [Pristionchus pacificus]|eukprot:PDM67581.1 hypothetical protein PRIPAC_48998 [Pristionchus pacificus]